MDKRSFFRINVMLPCSYHIMSPKKAKENPLPSSTSTAYIEKYFLEDLAQLDKQIHDIIAQIDQKSSMMSTALTAINSKVNFVLQTISEKSLSRAIPQRMVNISASGLAFDVEEAPNITDIVDILIKPLKEKDPILLRCKIINIIRGIDCETCFTISIEFQNIKEEDRRNLIAFIQQQELQNSQRINY